MQAPSPQQHQQPVIVLNTNTEREVGFQAQVSNIEATKCVADVIRTCLGPKAMLKMLIDPMGGVVITNDGYAIVREIDVKHPAAKSMLELCRAQDEEVGDGTTSVLVLAGEILAAALPFLERKVHPTIIINGYRRALKDALKVIDEISKPVDVNSDSEMLSIISTAIATKISSQWSDFVCNLALKSVRAVSLEYDASGAIINTTTGAGSTNNPIISRREIDTKRYVRIEKVPGGLLTQSDWIDGVILNKDIVHPNMKRRIEKPRIVLLDCSLEYKKGESQMNIELSKSTDWKQVLDLEEEQIQEMCEHIINVKPDLVITEKGISDLAQHYLMKAGISALRRIKKSDSYRISRATGATIVNRLEDLKESDVGEGAGIFYIDKIGDEYYSFIRQCSNPKACTILLRGPSKDYLNEIERNLHDAISVARNVFYYPKLCPGGGATEMAISTRLDHLSKDIKGTERFPYKAVAQAFEVIPRTLVQNCGSNNTVNIITELRSKHVATITTTSSSNGIFGIDGTGNGEIVDMNQYGVWEPSVVKSQIVKTAIESACMMLRIDDIVAGVGKSEGESVTRSMSTAGEDQPELQQD